MLTEYINAAMHRAKYKLIGDRTFFGEIPGLDGLWANAENLEACRDELEESLEEWILLGLQLGHPIPAIDGKHAAVNSAQPSSRGHQQRPTC